MDRVHRDIVAVSAGLTRLIWILAVSCCLSGTGCTSNQVPGPDKQFSGAIGGAASGAGSGAVTGFQVGAGAGPGAAVGAGIGAIVGGIEGIMADQEEERMLALAAATTGERRRAWVHEVLSDHYKRRLALHPTRDIFPADLFFDGDEGRLRPSSEHLVAEIARLNKRRLPWSRLEITAYSRANSEDSAFAKQLAEKRSQAIGNGFVNSGIEPRRIVARGVIVNAPILVDPDDNPQRYNQAIEITPLDR